MMDINIQEVEGFFSQHVPDLPFRLAGENIITLDATNINNAIDLIYELSKTAHPSVEEFLEVVVSDDIELPEDYETILTSKGYIRFIFYLTIYSGLFEQMLTLHCLSYIPKIGIELDSVKKTEYYPAIIDERLNNNAFTKAFEGDIGRMFDFIGVMEKTFVRVFYDNDYLDLSATDILGYKKR